MTSTSGTYSFSPSVMDLVTCSMGNIGKLGENEIPSSKEYSDCVFRLNLLVKQLQGSADFSKGIKMWTRRIGYLFLSNSIGQYELGTSGDHWTNAYQTTHLTYNAPASTISLTLDSTAGINGGDNLGVQLADGSLFWTKVVGAPVGSSVTIADTLPAIANSGAVVFTYTVAAQAPLETEYAFLRDKTNQDTTIKIINLQDYALIPGKTDVTNKSDPTEVYIENHLGYSILSTDCGAAQDVTKVVVVGYLETIQDISGNPAETIEYPQEYFRAIAWSLSKEITPMFNAEWTSLMQELTQQSMAIATGKDPDISTLHFLPGVN